MAKLRYKDGDEWKSIAPSQKEFDDLKDQVALDKLDYEQHLDDIMPHLVQDLQSTKTYKYGFQLSTEGNPQIIFEEEI